MNGLEKITAKIIEEAETYRSETEAKYRAEAETVMSEYRQKADAIRSRIEAESERDTAARRERAASASAADARRSLQNAKSALVDGVFTQALDVLRNLDEASYYPLLVKLASEAVAEREASEAEQKRLYGEDPETDLYELLLSSADREKYGARLLADVRKASGRGEKLVLADESAKIDGGIVLRCGDIECCASLSALVAGVRPELENRVYEILFPGA